jgi:hypothetical protein
LLSAELDGARGELAELLRRGLALALLVAVAAGLAFWALGAATAAAIAGLSLWLPVWGAALVLFAVFAGAALVLALVARARLRRLEGPGAILQRRAENHLRFWREEVFGADEVGGGEDGGAGRSARDGQSAGAAGGGPAGGRPSVSMSPPADDLEGFEP